LCRDLVEQRYLDLCTRYDVLEEPSALRLRQFVRNGIAYHHAGMLPTLKELVEYVKARPGQVNVTNPGVGTSNHLGQELFFSITGLEMQNVMYKGQPQMIPDVASGQVSFSLMTTALAVPHIKEGKLRALAISAPRRVPELPDVPTVAEAGYPDAMFLPWYGFVAAAATPKDIVKKLSDAIQKALASPDVIARLEKMGALVTPLSGPEFDKLLRSESVRWATVIKQRNIRAPE
jgi:tripartite-type tricarboxylate transporter receptor subunit TctC